jgi:NADPH-dependent glutamate synthase beta subunit-like oxidoreductase
VGEDLTLDELESSFDGVVLALGLGGQRKLGVAGEDLSGVISGMDLLASAKSGDAKEMSGQVVVIGGGNAAMDAAQTALRLGAEKVSVVSLEKEGELPAFDHEVKQCRDEAVSFYCGWGVTKIREKEGRVNGVELANCRSLFNQKGNFAPELDCSRVLELKADYIIVAIGQDGGLMTRLLGDDREIDSLTLATSRPKVFAAGDCCQGPGSAVAAMASGRRAAESLNLLFADKPLAFNRSYAGPVVTDYEIKPQKGSGEARVEPAKKDFGGKGDFGLLEECFTPEEASKEALRCLSCGGPFGKYRTCWFCLPCEVECPEDALWVDVPYLLR